MMMLTQQLTKLKQHKLMMPQQWNKKNGTSDMTDIFFSFIVNLLTSQQDMIQYYCVRASLIIFILLRMVTVGQNCCLQMVKKCKSGWLSTQEDKIVIKLNIDLVVFKRH